MSVRGADCRNVFTVASSFARLGPASPQCNYSVWVGPREECFVVGLTPLDFGTFRPAGVTFCLSYLLTSVVRSLLKYFCTEATSQLRLFVRSFRSPFILSRAILIVPKMEDGPSLRSFVLTFHKKVKNMSIAYNSKCLVSLSRRYINAMITHIHRVQVDRGLKHCGIDRLASSRRIRLQRVNCDDDVRTKAYYEVHVFVRGSRYWWLYTKYRNRTSERTNTGQAAEEILVHSGYCVDKKYMENYLIKKDENIGGVQQC